MFITFEGPEGGGKSTAIQTAAAHLRELGHTVLCTREPGAGDLGVQIRSLLLHGEDLAPQTELLLFLADRSNHVAKIIRPALERGDIVICDRFADSTLVYQGFARGLDIDFVKSGNQFATQGLRPDLSLLFDLPPEVGLARISNKDRLDAEPLEFHKKVREGFLKLASEDRALWKVIDACQGKDEVAQEAVSAIMEKLRPPKPEDRG